MISYFSLQNYSFFSYNARMFFILLEFNAIY